MPAHILLMVGPLGRHNRCRGGRVGVQSEPLAKLTGLVKLHTNAVPGLHYGRCAHVAPS